MGSDDPKHLINRAHQLFVNVAETHKLQLEWHDQAPVELAAHLRKQPGLDWDLLLNLQNVDEIGVQHEFFYVEWFPANDPKKEAEFVSTVDGLIAGDVRLQCRFGRANLEPYVVDFQREIDGRWSTFYRYRNGLHFGRAKSILILRNGHADASE